MSKCVYNFSAGPAMLPSSVLEALQRDLVDFEGRGLSIASIGHRTDAFLEIAKQAENDLRDLLTIPETHAVLFLAGGARCHFASIAMNLLRGHDKAAYVKTGHWSAVAIEEAQRYCTVDVLLDTASSNHRALPSQAHWKQPDDACAYMFYVPNETIGGLQFHWVPESDLPLVADMTSCLLSEPVDVSRYGLILAGCQKNLGIAGLSVVIVRRDLLGQAAPWTPGVLDYSIASKTHSMLNTPPTVSWYVAQKMFAWVKEEGGLDVMSERAHARAAHLYQFIDQHPFYSNPIEAQDRSLLNVPFLLKDKTLETSFLAQAEQRGLWGLQGHRSVGGLRASMYNAMPYEGVECLVEFMSEFARAHQGGMHE